MQHHTIARHVMTRYTAKVKSYNCFETGFSLTSKTMLRFCLHIPRQIQDINNCFDSRFSLADISQKVVVIRLVLRVIFRH